MNVFDYSFRSLDGANMPMERWRGQPILLVNTASECGYTPQYSKLQRLYHEYQKTGFMVIGVPSNDFGGQEPGTEEEIREFCTSKFDVRFPMTSKVTFAGPEAHPMFVDLVEQYTEDVLPRWNFFKYLFGRDGELVEFWPSSIEPDAIEFRRIIEQNLGSWTV